VGYILSTGDTYPLAKKTHHFYRDSTGGALGRSVYSGRGRQPVHQAKRSSTGLPRTSTIMSNQGTEFTGTEKIRITLVAKSGKAILRSEQLFIQVSALGFSAQLH